METWGKSPASSTATIELRGDRKIEGDSRAEERKPVTIAEVMEPVPTNPSFIMLHLKGRETLGM